MIHMPEPPIWAGEWIHNDTYPESPLRSCNSTRPWYRFHAWSGWNPSERADSFSAHRTALESAAPPRFYIGESARAKHGPELLAACAESRSMGTKPWDNAHLKKLTGAGCWVLGSGLGGCGVWTCCWSPMNGFPDFRFIDGVQVFGGGYSLAVNLRDSDWVMSTCMGVV